MPDIDVHVYARMTDDMKAHPYTLCMYDAIMVCRAGRGEPAPDFNPLDMTLFYAKGISLVAGNMHCHRPSAPCM